MPDRLDLAVFGTLSNGASARLLAQTTSRPVSAELHQRLQKLFDSVRGHLTEVDGVHYAFLPESPREGAPWLLLRLDPPQRGAIGEVGRLWAAILSLDLLGDIGWAVHRLFDTAFPEPHQPETGSVLDPRPLQLAAEPDIPEPVLRACDWAVPVTEPIALGSGLICPSM